MRLSPPTAPWTELPHPVNTMPSTAHALHPGDVVSFTVGGWVNRARVIEDRGHIGVGGRQIVRLEALGEEDFGNEPRRAEMAAADVVLEQPAAK
jgi:hypothetical protein